MQGTAHGRRLDSTQGSTQDSTQDSTQQVVRSTGSPGHARLHERTGDWLRTTAQAGAAQAAGARQRRAARRLIAEHLAGDDPPDPRDSPGGEGHPNDR